MQGDINLFKHNIMIVINDLTGGGAERVATNLASELSKTENVVMVVENISNNTYGSTVRTIDLHLKHKRFDSKILRIIRFSKRLKVLKKQLNITHSISFMQRCNLPNILSKYNDMVIVSIRNHLSAEYKNGYRMGKNRFILKRADKVVALSKMVKFDLINNYHISPNKINVIYNPSYRKQISEEIISGSISDYEFDILNKHKGKIVLTAGRLEEQKGQWHLIRAFSKVVEKIPDAILIILGKGRYENYLKKIIDELGLANKIYLFGYKKNPYIYMKKADIFCFTSLFEGLGNILLECMACSLPIISVDCPYGPKELLAPSLDITKFVDKTVYGEYGILTPPIDGTKYNAKDPLIKAEKEISNAIIKLISDKKMKMHYAQKSLERSEDFDVDDITRQWKELL